MTHLVTTEKQAGSNAARVAAADGAPLPRLAARTDKYLNAVLHGKWVVHYDWVLACRKVPPRAH